MVGMAVGAVLLTVLGSKRTQDEEAHTVIHGVVRVLVRPLRRLEHDADADADLGRDEVSPTKVTSQACPATPAPAQP